MDFQKAKKLTEHYLQSQLNIFGWTDGFDISISDGYSVYSTGDERDDYMVDVEITSKHEDWSGGVFMTVNTIMTGNVKNYYRYSVMLFEDEWIECGMITVNNLVPVPSRHEKYFWMALFGVPFIPMGCFHFAQKFIDSGDVIKL